ncbi:MAG: translation elongation factor-like protein [Candidatus Aenigmarchaeota archaeon]|nr:translation elongation factor-like protein [Candidatus Aenigmarchaeota archaeon]
MHEHEKKLVGEITHFFGELSVAVVELEHGLKVGQKVSIEGHTTAFMQTIDSMQIRQKGVAEAKKGESVGIKVIDRVRRGDKVYLVEEF